MNRRKFLTTTATATLIGLAGCSDINPTNNNNNNTNTPTNNQSNQSELETIERPENGYISKETGDIRWDEIDKDAEYVFAAEEAYYAGQTLLGNIFNQIEFALTEISGNNPDFEQATAYHSRAQVNAETTNRLHDHAIELLNEVEETDAIELVEENQDMVQDLQTLIDNLGTVIERYKDGDRGYAVENAEEIESQYKDYQNQNIGWLGIEPEIENEYYNQ